MSLFDLLGKLKNIFRGNIQIHDLLHHVININYIRIEQHSPPDAAPIDQIAPNQLILNLDKLSELPLPQQEAIRAAFHEAVLVDDTPLLQDSSKSQLEDIKDTESDLEIKELLAFFKDKIHSEDFAALRSAIYIKNKFDAHAPEVRVLRSELRDKFGLRGIKISNLWSENYFKNLIMPLYRELSTHSGFSNDEFKEMFNLIVQEEAFAIFVPSTMTSDQLNSIVHKKILKNMRYGVYSITIHGIGKDCVETIQDTMSYIESNHEVIDRSISVKKSIIRAKFWFRKH